MTLREVPRWAYVALASVWASTVLVDAAAISLDPAVAGAIAWGELLAKRGLVALFWMSVSVGALAWFHDRPVRSSNVARMFGATALLALATVALYVAYLTLALVVVTLGEASLRESFDFVWSGKIIHAYVTAWLVAGLANLCHEYRRGLARQREAEQLRLALAETELSLLRAQLEPHFLFNALNSIASLVRLERNDAATDALSKLGQLLRGMLEVHDDPIVAWEWERDFTELYVALQKLRFGDRLAIAWRVADMPATTPFPAFLLQPLIENAIRHGRLRDGETCSIEVEVHASPARARVEVRNAVAPGDAAGGPGIGLRNIEARLRALYPGDFHFTTSREGDRFVARADFPIPAEPVRVVAEATP
jgi:sensor histidine kinase YesM